MSEICKVLATWLATYYNVGEVGDFTYKLSYPDPWMCQWTRIFFCRWVMSHNPNVFLVEISRL